MSRSSGLLLILMFVGSLAAGCAPATPTLVPGDSERTVTVGDVERSYLLHVPPGLVEDRPVPVVFAFHAAGGDASGMQRTTGLDDIADSNGFLVAYPEGTEHTWNAGGCCGAAVYRNVDEPAFIRQLLADLNGDFTLDNKRIYALGFSNGASLTYRLACEMPEIFAAVGQVAGGWGPRPCNPQQPVSIITMLGLKDDVVPYEGGGELNLPPAEEVISNWAKRDGCAEKPAVDTEQKFLKHISYSGCDAGAAVELYAIEIGYHAWPSDTVLPASQVIWDFFEAHPKP